MRIFALTLLILITLGNTSVSFAQNQNEPTPPKIYELPKGNGTSVLPSPTGDFITPLKQETFLKTTAVNILNLVSNFFIGLAVFFLVIAGLEYILARGDEEMIKKSHQAALWAVIGVVVVMFAYTIIAIINTLL